MRKIFAVLLFLSACAGSDPTPQDNLPTKAYQLSDGRTNKVKATLSLEVADTDDARRSGLMNRTQLSTESGMIFVFDNSDYWSMWMKNTLIPLDMLFLNDSGKITSIAAHRKPLSEEFITPCNTEYEKRSLVLTGQDWDSDDFFDECEARFSKPFNATKYVIELPAGAAANYGLKIGDKMKEIK